MHRFTSVLFAVACLSAQAETTTTATTGATKATYDVTYEFTFQLKAGVTPTESQIKTAAEQAVVGLQITGASVIRTIEPTKKTVTINGEATQLWTTSFSCTIPNSASKTQTTTDFTAKKFAESLQTQLSGQNLADVQISSATFTGADGSKVQAAIPDPAKPESCGKDRVMAGCFAIFLAAFGVARFYYGYILAGIFKLLLGLVANCGSCVAGKQAKSESDMADCCKRVSLFTCSCELGFFIWWIYDMVVIWNSSLKPFGKNDNCVFD